MQQRQLGRFGRVSVLTLGGGGLGQLWGETSRAECVATVRAAVDAGIDLLDLAPRYGDGEAERVVGAAFEGKLPAGVRVTSKCLLGDTPPAEVEARLRQSLADSLDRLRLPRLDLFFLHSNIVPDDHEMRRGPLAAQRATPISTYREAVRPAMAKFVAEGLVAHWGITAIGHPDALEQALAEDPKPTAAQCIGNPLDSAGELQFFDGALRPRDVIATANANGVGVLGIRAVQGGALTESLDRDLPAEHGVVRDFARAARFRALAAELGEPAARLAHRYALSMDGIATVVLGVKNRAELADCVAAAEAGPLPADTIARIDASVAP
ncbi:MAG: aldo/keto reductase [Alphaproteobacteria bacterium]